MNASIAETPSKYYILILLLTRTAGEEKRIGEKKNSPNTRRMTMIKQIFINEINRNRTKSQATTMPIENGLKNKRRFKNDNNNYNRFHLISNEMLILIHIGDGERRLESKLCYDMYLVRFK